MKFKAIATAGIIAGLTFTPAEPVHADAGDAIAGALIGGIIGHAIAKDQQKRKSFRKFLVVIKNFKSLFPIQLAAPVLNKAN